MLESLKLLKLLLLKIVKNCWQLVSYRCWRPYPAVVVVLLRACDWLTVCLSVWLTGDCQCNNSVKQCNGSVIIPNGPVNSEVNLSVYRDDGRVTAETCRVNWTEYENKKCICWLKNWKLKRNAVRMSFVSHTIGLAGRTATTRLSWRPSVVLPISTACKRHYRTYCIPFCPSVARCARTGASVTATNERRPFCANLLSYTQILLSLSFRSRSYRSS